MQKISILVHVEVISVVGGAILYLNGGIIVQIFTIWANLKAKILKSLKV